MGYDPAWWQLAYTTTGDLVGLIMPALSPTYATIGYIGVVPEHRGRGYIDDLLHQATAILSTSGAMTIRADTDIANLPMANAFRRAGYAHFAMRREYRLHPAS
jgi:RimJ/RimL family protein N-acetyltransferase